MEVCEIAQASAATVGNSVLQLNRMLSLVACLQYYLGDDFPRPVIGGELAASQLSGTNSGSNITLFATLSLPNDQVRPCLLHHASTLLAEGHIADGHIAKSALITLFATLSLPKDQVRPYL